MAERSLAKVWWYNVLRFVCRTMGVIVFQIRVDQRHQVPAEGGVLLLSNHQSHFDPVLVGLCCDRRLNYLARETLFRFTPFRWLINSLDAIPIDREGLGMSGLKETLRRLKRAEVVLIFPEGTRSRDGHLSPLKPGFSALAKRARVPLVPVAIDGAFQAWPRWQKLPGRGIVQIQFGPPLWPEEIAQFDDRQLVAEVERRIAACFHRAQWLRSRRCQPVAAGDEPPALIGSGPSSTPTNQTPLANAASPRNPAETGRPVPNAGPIDSAGLPGVSAENTSPEKVTSPSPVEARPAD